MTEQVQDPTFQAVVELFEESGYRRTMGFRFLAEPDGRAVIECDVSAQYANTMGVAHGGLISGIIDTAAGVAVKLAAGDPGLKVSTVSLTVNYHRPAQVGQTLRATGRHLSGKGTPCCSVEVRSDEGKHVATGIATMRVLGR